MTIDRAAPSSCREAVSIARREKGPAMTRTQLTDVIDHAVERSTATAFARWADKMAEDMAKEVMKDKAFKAEMIALARAAFRRALTQLQEEVS